MRLHKIFGKQKRGFRTNCKPWHGTVRYAVRYMYLHLFSIHLREIHHEKYHPHELREVYHSGVARGGGGGAGGGGGQGGGGQLPPGADLRGAPKCLGVYYK